MTLHLACKFGVVSYLYEIRHEIAYSIGLIAEVPIATCDGNYFLVHAPLIIEDAETAEKQMASTISTTTEIILYSQSIGVSFTSARAELKIIHYTCSIEARYTPPTLAIFRPPCEA